jgi:hypothetical protein
MLEVLASQSDIVIGIELTFSGLPLAVKGGGLHVEALHGVIDNIDMTSDCAVDGTDERSNIK